MKYTGFAVKNFKGVNEEGIVIKGVSEGKVITLIGLNESGKTTILEGISHVSVEAGEQGALYIEKFFDAEPEDLIPLSKRDNFNGLIEVVAGVKISEDDVQRIMNFSNENFGYVLDRESVPEYFTITKEMSFKNSLYQGTKKIWGMNILAKKGRQRVFRDLHDVDKEVWLDLIGYISDRLPKILYFPTFLFEIPEKIWLNPGEDEKPINRYYRDVVQDILDCMDNDLDVKKHIVDRVLSQSSDEKANKRALSQVIKKMEKVVSKEVSKGWDKIFSHKSAAKDINFDITVEEGEVYLSFKLSEGDSVYSISERSLGFRWFFSFLLFTHFRVYRRENSNVIFLLDEPASNLHPKAQQQLMKMFERIADSGSTIIYSTHSHHMIDPRRLESAYIVRNLGVDYDSDVLSEDFSPSETEIVAQKYKTFSGNNPQRTTYFQPVLDALDYSFGAIEFPGRAILTEGKSDFYAYSIFKGDRNFAVVPGIGSSTLDVVISLYLGWSRDFVVVLDDDKEGRKARDRYINDFGLSSGHVVTYGDIDDKFKGFELENLFLRDDREGLINKNNNGDFIKYNKKVFSRAIQEELAVKDEDAFLFSEETRDNFEKIFDYADEVFSSS